MDLAALRRVAREATDNEPRSARIYWTDLLLSATVAWAAFAATLVVSFGIPARCVFALLSALALYRAAYFVHEIAHFKKGSLPGFSFAWHVLIGVPAGVPSVMAEMHKDHHRRATYGTPRDPEYAPVAAWSATQIVLSVLLMIVIPPFLFLRWALVTPISVLHPRLRRLTVAYLSTLAINPSYARPQPPATERRKWLAQELGCALFAWGVVALVALGVVPYRIVLTWWLVLGVALAVNQLKTLVTHAFEHEGEHALTSEAQMLDSITVGGSWLSEIFAPLGNRYHAIHHMLPDVPYHQLPRIHRRLVELDDAGYASTQRRGFFNALGRLWARARDKRKSPGSRARARRSGGVPSSSC